MKGNGGNILSGKASQKLGLLTVAGHVVNTTEVVVVRCDKAVVRCDKAVVRCDKAVVRCDKPVLRCDKPVVRCDKAGVRCDKAVVRCDKPVLRCDKPVVRCDKAVLRCDKPVVRCDKPVVRCDKAVLRCDKAVVRCDKPVVRRDKPVVRCDKAVVRCDNPSDYLSRHPQVSEKSSRGELVAEEYVNFIAAESVPKAMSYAEVLAATLDDPTLSAVKELLFTDRWHMLETVYGRDPSVDYEALQSYSRVGTQLTVTVDGLLLKASQIVIPTSLQRQVLELAHEGHQGVYKTKSISREKVWFPRIDVMVAKLLDECIACTASYDPKAREPLVMTELPSRKWSHLCADFYVPLPSGEYLLVVLDEYSRFPEVEIVKSLSAQTVIPIFDNLFSSRGIPEN